jgi:hypothetical protein
VAKAGGAQVSQPLEPGAIALHFNDYSDSDTG